MNNTEKLQKKIEQLEKDKKNLMNRCFVLSKGLLCTFCEFEGECDNRKEFEAPKKECNNRKEFETPKKVRNRSNIFD